MNMRILTTIALFLCLHFTLSAQTTQKNYSNTGKVYSRIDQERIEQLANTVLRELPAAEKDSISNVLKEELQTALQNENAFRTSFNQVKSISILTAPDSSFRVFNWEIAYLDGTNRYECLLLKKNETGTTLEVLEPLDSILERKELQNKQLGTENWLPALYYDIVLVKSRFQTFYTLLAWDANDLLTNKKYIEVLWFDKEGKTNFGAPIFRDNRSVQSRVIFEYGGQNSMTLNSEEELNRISFNHLAPPSSNLEGIFEYYGADVSFDAYDWNGKHWKSVQEVIPSWADPKGRTNAKVTNRRFEKEDVANPNAAKKILKDAEKRKKKADDELKEESEKLKEAP